MSTPRIDTIDSLAEPAGAALIGILGNLVTNPNNSVAPIAPTFVNPSRISVPYTTITNRASIPDPSNDLGVRMGVDRVMTQQIYQLQNEFGPAGQPVYGVINDPNGYIRFVGGWNSTINANGPFLLSSTITDFAEVTFYGTGLNVLVYLDGNARGFTYSVDGGSFVSGSYPSNGNSIIVSRNYNANSILNVVSGLAIGTHTVKILFSGSFAQSGIFGFEILTVATTPANITVQPGTGWGNSSKAVLSAQSTLSYNANVTGTKGGRAVTYLTNAGAVSQVFQAVNSTAAYLSSASHTNEEVARSYSPREFGAARSDDFSVSGVNGNAGALAFTLDDGTTTLISNAAYFYITGSAEGLTVNATSNYIVFTFVGCGLDVQIPGVSGSTDTWTISIDGTSQGSIGPFTSTVVQKIASGLAYGTHSVQFTRVVVNNVATGFSKFIVYQPAKPLIPSSAVELSDYNVMATYVANTTIGKSYIGTGVLRKSSAREQIYVGTGWSTGAGGDPLSCSGLQCNSGTAGNYVQYTFFGTGFDWRFFVGNGALSYTVSVDGSTNLSGFTTSLYASGLTFTAATGAISGTGTSVYANGLSVSNLTLGLHTIKLTYNSGTSLYLDCFDIVTPIHTYKYNGPFIFQNTASIGSQSVLSSRAVSANAVNQGKAIAQAFGITSSPTTTSSLMAPVPDMSLTIKTNGGRVLLGYSISGTNTSSTQGVLMQMYVDGIAVGQVKNIDPEGTNFPFVTADNIITYLAPGTHKVDVYWSVSGGTGQAYSTNRNLFASEI